MIVGHLYAILVHTSYNIYPYGRPKQKHNDCLPAMCHPHPVSVPLDSDGERERKGREGEGRRTWERGILREEGGRKKRRRSDAPQVSAHRPWRHRRRHGAEHDVRTVVSPSPLEEWKVWKVIPHSPHSPSPLLSVGERGTHVRVFLPCNMPQ